MGPQVDQQAPSIPSSNRLLSAVRELRVGQGGLWVRHCIRDVIARHFESCQAHQRLICGDGGSAGEPDRRGSGAFVEVWIDGQLPTGGTVLADGLIVLGEQQQEASD